MWLKNSDVAQLSTSGSGSSLRQRYNRQSNLQVNLKARPSLGNPLSHPVMWLSAGFRRRASRLVVWLRACVSAGCCNKHHRLAVYTAVLEAGSLGSRGRQGFTPPKAPGEGPPPPPVSGGSGCALSAVCPSIFTASFLCVLCASLKRMLVTGFRAYPKSRPVFSSRDL